MKQNCSLSYIDTGVNIQLIVSLLHESGPIDDDNDNGDFRAVLLPSTFKVLVFSKKNLFINQAQEKQERRSVVKEWHASHFSYPEGS